jgi:hypothetical protein
MVRTRSAIEHNLPTFFINSVTWEYLILNNEELDYFKQRQELLGINCMLLPYLVTIATLLSLSIAPNYGSKGLSMFESYVPIGGFARGNKSFS